jgi:hypothetical protein
VQLTFSDGTVLDPTVSNACLGATTLSVVQNSPLFQTTDWVMNGVDVGTAQYIDGFQRAKASTFPVQSPELSQSV